MVTDRTGVVRLLGVIAVLVPLVLMAVVVGLIVWRRATGDSNAAPAHRGVEVPFGTARDAGADAAR